MEALLGEHCNDSFHENILAIVTKFQLYLGPREYTFSVIPNPEKTIRTLINQRKIKAREPVPVPAGPWGATGMIGPMGATGVQGPVGATGSIGPVGYNYGYASKDYLSINLCMRWGNNILVFEVYKIVKVKLILEYNDLVLETMICDDISDPDSFAEIDYTISDLFEKVKHMQEIVSYVIKLEKLEPNISLPLIVESLKLIDQESKEYQEMEKRYDTRDYLPTDRPGKNRPEEHEGDIV
jgi:hypothetical protein